MLGQSKVAQDALALLSNPDAASSMVEVLVKFKETVSEPLTRKLETGFNHLECWVAAIRALRGIEDRAGVEPLVKALVQHSGFGYEPDIQREVVEALEQLDSDWREAAVLQQNIPSFIGMLRSNDYWIRSGAIELMGRLRDPRAVKPLIDLFGRAGEEQAWRHGV